MSRVPIDADVAVLGGGPAGLAAAEAGARAGLFVVLAQPGPARATHRTHVPARALGRLARAPRDGELGEAGWRELRAKARTHAETWAHRQALRLEDLGVERLDGHARFLDAHRIIVGEQEVRFDRAVVAAGGRARSLPGVAPDGKVVLRPDDLIDLPALPSSVIVVGGEAAGAETVDMLQRLGVEVAWIMDELGILPSFDRELSEALGDLLMDRGVKIIHRKRVTEVGMDDRGRPKIILDGGHDYKADAALLAVGSALDLEPLAPSEAGLRIHGSGALWVDAHTRTNVEHIFGAGECTGRSLDVAGATSMGRLAGLRAAGEDAPAFDAEAMVRTVHTDPPVAQVGLSPEASAGREVELVTVAYDEALVGVLDEIGATKESKGFLRIVIDGETDRVLGGSACGPRAGELLTLVALARHLGATRTDLSGVFAPIPSFADLVLRAFR